MQWYRELCEFQKKHIIQKGNIHSAPCTGPVGAYLSLAYDLYLLRHHSLLQKSLIERIKNKDQFQGARYELYVAASFIKAAFDINFEDETDRSKSHCEFVATHRYTKQEFSVEAKSRHRPGLLGQKGPTQKLDQIKLRIGKLLNDAFKKIANHPRIVFLDVNMRPEDEQNFNISWFHPLAKIISQIETQQIKENKIIPAFLFFTNHPYHYVGKDEIEPSKNFFLTAINIPEFKKNNINMAKETHPIIFSLWESINKHIRVPHDFSEFE